MRLEEKLQLVESIEGFCTLLNKAEGSVDWNGRRVASVKGYEGNVEIEAIAGKFLSFPHFIELEVDTPLAERLGLYETWEKIEKLYHSSGEGLKTARVYRYAIPALETALYYSRSYPTSLDIILGWTSWGKEEYIFQFKPLEFAKIWPNSPPKREIFMHEDYEWTKMKVATKEMVAAVTLSRAVAAASAPESTPDLHE